jgi:hypothetical protein
MSSISCNEHNDGSIFKFGAQSNAFKMIEKWHLVLFMIVK